MRRMMVVPLLLSFPAFAQDAGQVAAQAAQQASMQAAQAAQQANDQAMQAAQQASQNAQNAAMLAASDNRVLPPALRPKFSVKPGTYTTPLTVRITDSTRHAVIYYTTNGWTPTTHSAVYDGPISIDASMRLQAIAVAPNLARSAISEADYVLPTSYKPEAVLVGPDAILRQGTLVPLVFASDLNSKTAQVGDRFALKLATEMKIGDRVVDPGTVQASGRVTAVDKRALGGYPGDISFAIDSMTIGGVKVPLTGGETEAAHDRESVRELAFIPLMQWSILRRGKDAEIHPGALVTATVIKDTNLHAR